MPDQVAARKNSDTAEDVLDDGLDYEVDFSESDAGVALFNDAPSEGPSNAPQFGTEDSAKAGKKRKAKTSNLHEKKRLKMEFDLEQKKNLSKEESTDVIADLVNAKIRQKEQDLSPLELSERYFDKSHFRSTADFTEKRSLDNLGEFIKSKFKNIIQASKKDKKSDMPEEKKFIAIVSMSAIRACDTHRSTRSLPGSSLKLINKNKLSADLASLKNSKSRLLCTTPSRLLKLLDHDEAPLKKDDIKIIIVDNSYLDSKCSNIWDYKETMINLKTLVDSGSKVYLY